MSATAFQRKRREMIRKMSGTKFEAEEVEVEIESNNEIEEVKEKSLAEMDLEELKSYAYEKGVNIGNANTEKGILKKIQEAEE